jgi:hypothetical protein
MRSSLGTTWAKEPFPQQGQRQPCPPPVATAHVVPRQPLIAGLLGRTGTLRAFFCTDRWTGVPIACITRV